MRLTMLGDQDGAMQLLRQAVGDQGIDLHADMDFESLKNNREFREFIRPKG